MFQHKAITLTVAALLASGLTLDAEAQRSRSGTTTSTSGTSTTTINPYADPWFGEVFGNLSWTLQERFVGEYGGSCSGPTCFSVWDLSLSGVSLLSKWEGRPDTSSGTLPPSGISDVTGSPILKDEFLVDFSFKYENGYGFSLDDEGDDLDYESDDDEGFEIVWSPSSGRGRGTLTEKVSRNIGPIYLDTDGAGPDCGPSPETGLNEGNPVDDDCRLDLFAVPGSPFLTLTCDDDLSLCEITQGGAFVTNTFSTGVGTSLPNECIESLQLGGRDGCNGASSGINGPNLTLNAAPEPGTVALLGLGLAGLGVARRRRTFTVS